jgi:hypothetical protein
VADDWAGYIKSDGDGVYASYVDYSAVEPRSGVTAFKVKLMLYQFVRGQASAKREVAIFLRNTEQRIPTSIVADIKV